MGLGDYMSMIHPITCNIWYDTTLGGGTSFQDEELLLFWQIQWEKSKIHKNMYWCMSKWKSWIVSLSIFRSDCTMPRSHMTSQEGVWFVSSILISSTSLCEERLTVEWLNSEKSHVWCEWIGTLRLWYSLQKGRSHNKAKSVHSEITIWTSDP